jgi:hypothetical protein
VINQLRAILLECGITPCSKRCIQLPLREINRPRTVFSRGAGAVELDLEQPIGMVKRLSSLNRID